MKILITGANGFLGRHLTHYLSSKKYRVIASGRGGCCIAEPISFQYYNTELTDKNAVAAMVAEVMPDVIVHTAAMSKPDECNKDKEECLRQNVAATQYLLEASRALQKPPTQFIYISTDFIFGENGPHSEDDAPGPLNFYGESKLLAEECVIKSGIHYSIVRPVFIYGPSYNDMRPTFLHWVKNNLEQGQKIKVVSDQKRTPTYVMDICSGIETIISKGLKGAYHLAGKDVLSPYQMAVTAANVLRLDAALIENVTSETFTEPVKRAKHSGLKIDKAQNEFSYKPVSFEEGVKLTFNIT